MNWKHLVQKLFLVSALTCPAMLPVTLAAQALAPARGIDPEVMAKANAGDASAQKAVGFAYVKGKGVPHDDGLAAAWYRKAAEQGDAEAEYKLGSFYQLGLGLHQDYAQAVNWYLKAALQDEADAEFNLAGLYEQGQGVMQNNEQATYWMYQAAEQGIEAAQYNIGMCYKNGHDVTQDYTQAAQWFLKAAEQGNSEAEYELGSLYLIGNGLQKNRAQALVWFRKAAEQGNVEAQNYVSRIQHEEEEAKKPRPRYVSVTAKGLGIVPGAIVCPSFAAVSQMFDRYSAHWEDSMQDSMTKGQSRLYRGQPASAPNLKTYGCVLLQPGTRMTLDNQNVVPVVSAKLSNGTTVKGVTLGGMIARR